MLLFGKTRRMRINRIRKVENPKIKEKHESKQNAVFSKTIP
jgi:hypothetical protein